MANATAHMVAGRWQAADGHPYPPESNRDLAWPSSGPNPKTGLPSFGVWIRHLSELTVRIEIGEVHRRHRKVEPWIAHLAITKTEPFASAYRWARRSWNWTIAASFVLILAVVVTAATTGHANSSANEKEPILSKPTLAAGSSVATQTGRKAMPRPSYF